MDDSEGERFVACQDGEMSVFQHVTEIPYRLVDSQELPVVGTIILVSRAQFPGEEGKGLQKCSKHCCRTAAIAVVEAYVAKASGAVQCGWDKRAA